MTLVARLLAVAPVARALALALVACTDGTATTDAATTDAAPGGSDGGATADAAVAAFNVTSSSFAQGATIPTRHECSSNGPGSNVSPPLAWSGAPASARSYAIVMRDLDFQSGFIHWVIWDIPESETSLQEDVEHVAEPTVPAGAKQASFSGSLVGYQGPCSPSSVNTYEITVYALPVDTLDAITPATPKAQAAAAIVNAAIAVARLSGES